MHQNVELIIHLKKINSCKIIVLHIIVHFRPNFNKYFQYQLNPPCVKIVKDLQMVFK